MKWDKMRVTREDCSMVKHRMEKCGLPLDGEPGSVSDMVICCASLLRAARRDRLGVMPEEMMHAWARWRGLSADELHQLQLQLMDMYRGCVVPTPFPEQIIADLGAIW